MNKSHDNNGKENNSCPNTKERGRRSYFVAENGDSEGKKTRVDALRQNLNKIKPNYEEGGKHSKFQSTFEAFESFLFVPNKTTHSGVQIRDAVDMKRTMMFVIIALIPCLLFGIWNVGYQHFLSYGEDAGFWRMIGYGVLKVLPIIVVSYVVGLTIEFIFAQIRHHQVNEGFLVTGILIPLVMPPDVPLWMVAVATAFAVIIGKEVFGGTGMNVVNPALTARAFLFFSYPLAMSGDKVWIADKADAFSGATPLGSLMTGNMDIPSAWTMFWGGIPGSIGETSKIAILLGGLFLILTGVASLRIIFWVFVGGLGTGLLFNIFGSTAYMQMPFYYHILMGGFMFGAFFMATDPVTAAQTQKGKIIYGILVGALAVLIRVVNTAYAEGMMLSILLMNVFAPLIDYYVVEANIKMRKKRALRAQVVLSKQKQS